MATKTKAAPDPYLKLIAAFRLRPIRSDEELDAATKIANMLAVRSDLTDDEQDYLDVLSDQIEAYERVHYPIPDVSGASMLRFLIESRGVTQTEVAKATKLTVSTISEILNGKRGMGRKHLEAFSRYFHIEPGAFLAESNP
jgi:HTH-type transcriptional regulator / antitoxin HigA